MPAFAATTVTLTPAVVGEFVSPTVGAPVTAASWLTVFETVPTNLLAVTPTDVVNAPLADLPRSAVDEDHVELCAPVEPVTVR